jgi:hypothetical protein
MSKTVFHTAASRGHANHGWLNAHHSFSFASYYDPSRIHFGVLRVLNDDEIAGGGGFGMHPHDNMEIITIPIEGDLEHKDNMGNVGVICAGDIQVMSAGTGVFHSEYNKHADRLVRLLQIWLFPDKQNHTPRYQQISLKLEDRINRLQQIVSPNEHDDGAWIHQDAWFSIGRFDEGQTFDYSFKKKGNGAYIFLLEGAIEIDGLMMNRRDGLGIYETDFCNIKVLLTGSELLIMDIPMH